MAPHGGSAASSEVPLGRRLKSELGLGAACLVLLALTAAWPEWIEAVFHVDPDGGNGALEWALVAVFAISAAVCSWQARRDWHLIRAQRASIVSPGGPGR